MTTICKSTGPDGDINIDVELGSRKVHLLRCQDTPDEYGILRPRKGVGDQVWNNDTNPWYEVLAVSGDCVYLTQEQVGTKIILPAKNGTGNLWAVGCAEKIMDERWFDKPGGPPCFVLMENGQ